MKQKISRSIPKSTRLLLALAKIVDTTSDRLNAFLLSAGSAKQLQRNLRMIDREYNSVFQGLRVHGYIQKVNEHQFLITPKALKKIKITHIETANWDTNKWDGFWRIIASDIPERKKKERNLLRSLIKRKNFIGIQNSVFVAPYADFEALAELRKDLEIEGYVSFFLAKSCSTDDDSKLRKKFNLN